jgi:hypothetical protein
MLLEHVTHALVPALAGYADADKNGKVSRKEFMGFMDRTGGHQQMAKGISAVRMNRHCPPLHGAHSDLSFLMLNGIL